MFALNFAKKSQSKRYILCEGYMDAIALHQAGFDTAVAPLGTAFTPEQAKLLSNYAEELVLSYDSDEAGQKATRRAIGLLANESMKVSILTVQGAKDPDEFIKKYGQSGSRCCWTAAATRSSMRSRAKAKYDLTKPDGQVGYLGTPSDPLRPADPDRAGRLRRAGRGGDERREKSGADPAGARCGQRPQGAKEREKALLEEGAPPRSRCPTRRVARKRWGSPLPSSS